MVSVRLAQASESRCPKCRVWCVLLWQLTLGCHHQEHVPGGSRYHPREDPGTARKMPAQTTPPPPAGQSIGHIRERARDAAVLSEGGDKGERLGPATRLQALDLPKRHGASSRTCARRGWPGPAVLSRGRLITGRREKTARIGRDAAAYGPSEN